uniref:Uncharacterized protein n=1 Tax=Anguilla anguilla TaxID=7936 RepID=A0A0E9XR31_ANGAN
MSILPTPPPSVRAIKRGDTFT